MIFTCQQLNPVKDFLFARLGVIMVHSSHVFSIVRVVDRIFGVNNRQCFVLIIDDIVDGFCAKEIHFLVILSVKVEEYLPVFIFYYFCSMSCCSFDLIYYQRYQLSILPKTREPLFSILLNYSQLHKITSDIFSRKNKNII